MIGKTRRSGYVAGPISRQKQGAMRRPSPEAPGPGFTRKLEDAGLKLGRGGGIKAPNVAGATNWSPEQIQLMQRGYDRFGINKNPAFDPTRASYTGQFYNTPGGNMPQFAVQGDSGRSWLSGGEGSGEPLDGLPSFDPDGSPVGPDRGPTPGLGYGRGGRFDGKRPTPMSPPPDLNGPLQRGLGYGGQYNGIYRQPGGPPPAAPKDRSVHPMQPEGQGFQPGAYNSGSTSEQIARNQYLNTLSESDKMQAMNSMGYWSGGVPQTARPYSGSTPEGLDPGAIWQAQQAGGGYAGYYTGTDGAPQFTSFAPQQRGAGRTRRRRGRR
jgi:hypothetical protein